MPLLRQVLQPLLQHDPGHLQELLSFSIRSASVSLSLYRRPHSYLILTPRSRNPSLQGTTIWTSSISISATFLFLGMHLFLFLQVINLLLKFIPLSIYPRYSLALQVHTTPAQHLDSTWSSPLNTTSASATTSSTASGRTSYINNLPLLALCAYQAQPSYGSTTTFPTWKLPR